MTTQYDRKSSLKWIFKYGNVVLNHKYEESALAIGKLLEMECLDSDDGTIAGRQSSVYSSDENIARHTSVLFELSKPYLENNDLEGWKQHCRNVPISPPIRKMWMVL